MSKPETDSARVMSRQAEYNAKYQSSEHLCACYEPYAKPRHVEVSCGLSGWIEGDALGVGVLDDERVVVVRLAVTKERVTIPEGQIR